MTENNELRHQLGLDEVSDGRFWLFSAEVAQVFSISEAKVRQLAKKGLLPYRSVRRQGGQRRGAYNRYELNELMAIFKDQSHPIYAAQKKAATSAHQPVATVNVHIPLRVMAPSQIEVFLGPTNSGKTFQALQYLVRRGKGVYACPLRMLAYEAYERLCLQMGAEQVGCVTGEERINEDAPIICCTAEMAPLHVELLVLDEVQWVDDKERGWAWTRLLLGAEVDELYLTGELGVEPLVQAIFGNEVPITYLERLCPLEFAGSISLKDIPGRSAVIAFSRKAVLHLAGLLAQDQRSVSVLYGALPPEVRRRQINAFIKGEHEVVVATDVIGHGINLPVDNVIFAETDKFDGEVRRNLADWELAQIAGRAGRFGLSEKGSVYVLKGVPGLTPNAHLVEAGLWPKIDLGDHKAYRLVNRAFIAPDLQDLGVVRSLDLPKALAIWMQQARLAFGSRPYIAISPLEPFLGRLAVLKRTPTPQGSVLKLLDLLDAWHLVRSPCDPDDDADVLILANLGRQLLQVKPASFRSLLAAAAEIKPSVNQESLEGLARQLDILRWATLVFGDRIDVTHAEVVVGLNQVADELNLQLKRDVHKGIAHCQSCGALCAPWFKECDRCHLSGRRSYYGGYDYGDEDEEEDDFADYRPAKKSKPPRDPELDIIVDNDPSLARPKFMPRRGWNQYVVPLLQQVQTPERQRLVELLIAQHNAAPNGHTAWIPVDLRSLTQTLS